MKEDLMEEIDMNPKEKLNVENNEETKDEVLEKDDRMEANEKDKEKIMAGFLATDRDSTVPDQWESQILCRILLKYKVIMVTQAPQKMVEEMQMDYAADLPEALRMADAYLGKENAPITVIPDGVSVIVRK